MVLIKKRGLSPVIATVLLISMALVLAVVVFLWARSQIGEQIEKENQNIELVCDQVMFVAEAYGGRLYIENTGNIALWGVEVRLKKTGEITGIKEFAGGVDGEFTVNPGRTIDLSFNEAGAGDVIIIAPILLGKSESKNDRVPHICDVDYGIEVIVGA